MSKDSSSSSNDDDLEDLTLTELEAALVKTLPGLLGAQRDIQYYNDRIVEYTNKFNKSSVIKINDFSNTTPEAVERAIRSSSIFNIRKLKKYTKNIDRAMHDLRTLTEIYEDAINTNPVARPIYARINELKEEMTAAKAIEEKKANRKAALQDPNIFLGLIERMSRELEYKTSSPAGRMELQENIDNLRLQLDSIGDTRILAAVHENLKNLQITNNYFIEKNSTDDKGNPISPLEWEINDYSEQIKFLPPAAAGPLLRLKSEAEGKKEIRETLDRFIQDAMQIIERKVPTLPQTSQQSGPSHIARTSEPVKPTASRERTHKHRHHRRSQKDPEAKAKPKSKSKSRSRSNTPSPSSSSSSSSKKKTSKRRTDEKKRSRRDRSDTSRSSSPPKSPLKRQKSIIEDSPRRVASLTHQRSIVQTRIEQHEKFIKDAEKPKPPSDTSGRRTRRGV